MGAGPLQHRPAQGGVSAGVGDYFCLQTGEHALFVAAGGDRDLHGMPLGMDLHAFGPGQAHLDRPFGDPGEEGGVMLYAHVLLAAEAAAHHGRLHPHLFRGQVQHEGHFLLGLVDALVAGDHVHALAFGTGHGAFRLQKGVLGEGQAEFGGHGVGGAGQSRVRVAVADPFVGQQIAFAARAFVDQRGSLRHGLLRRKHAGKRLVFHFDQGKGFSDCLFAFPGHQSQSVPAEAGDLARRDQHRVVVEQVADHQAAGYIICSEHGGYSRRLGGLRRVDGEYFGPRVFRTQGRAEEHALHGDVVGVSGRARGLGVGVHPGQGQAQVVAFRIMQLLFAPLHCGGQQYGLFDLFIAGAAADIVAQGLLHLLRRGGGVGVQQGLGADYHAGDAETALHGPARGKGPGIEVPLRRSESLQSEDACALQPVRLQGAGLAGLAVHQNGAGAAGAFAAAVLHRGQAQVVPEQAQQSFVFGGGHGLTVHRKAGHFWFSFGLEQIRADRNSRGTRCG